MESRTFEVSWTDPTALEVHPLNAVLVPEMTPEEFETLKESMRLKGFLETEAVRVLRGTNLVVDGKNRLRAARELGIRVAVTEVEIPEEDLSYFILSSAYHRRDIPTGIRAASAAYFYDFVKQNSCHKEDGPQGAPAGCSLGAFLSTLYNKKGGRRREFLARFFKVSNRDFDIAYWLKRFLPEDFDALRRGEMTMAEAREIYRKAKPEMSAREALIEEWRELEKRVPEFSRVSVLLGYMDEESQRELFSVLRSAVRREGSPEVSPEALMEIPEVRELVERAEKLSAEKARLEERLGEVSEMEERLKELQAEKAELERRVEELEERSREVVTVGDPETEAELERLRTRLSEVEAELEEARSEAETFAREMDGLEEEKRKLMEENEKLVQELKEARRHIIRLVKGIDPRKKRAKRRLLDKITRQYEKRLEKLREKNQKLKELLIEVRSENERLKEIIGSRALKAVPVKLAHMFMAMTGLLCNKEFREAVVGLIQEAEVDAGELLDLMTELEEAVISLGSEILSAIKDRKEQLQAAVEADDFVVRELSATIKSLPRVKEEETQVKEKEREGNGGSVPPKKIKLRVRRNDVSYSNQENR